MKKYKYSARTKEGAVENGTMESRSKESVVESLQGKGLIVVNVKEESGFSLEHLSQINIGGVPMKEKVVFMRQMATMVSAGLPLTQALEILEKQITNPQFKKVISDVLGSVQGGMGLSEAFRRNSKVFDDITISLIEAGEASGHLDTVLQRVATETENSKKLQDKIKSAFNYPIIITVVVIGVIALLMIVLVPAMSDIYSQFDAELPLVTRILMNSSKFMTTYWWLILMLILGIGISVKLYADTPGGKIFFNKAVLKMPVFGNLITNMQITQFTRILSLLLKSGLSITEALKLTSDSLSNLMYKQAVLDAKEEVERGVALAVPIARSPYFPLIVSQMIGVGEESGEIDTVLEKMAQFYNEEVEQMTSNLTSLMEPVILVVMGGVIGFIALAVYMPMFSLTKVIG